MNTPRHWILAAPFIAGPGDTWLDRFVPGSRHCFATVPATYAHDRSRRQTSVGQWRDYFVHANAAWRARRQAGHAVGIITVFPQLALAVGLRQRLSRQHTPVLAWTFNVGHLPGGMKGRLARAAMREVDRFVVHSRVEVAAYSDWLDVPPERFSYVPLQRPLRPIEFVEDEREPFLLAMGSARRDYRLFFDVVEALGYRTIVVAGAQALVGLRIPSNVSVRSGLDIAECHALAQRARINVVPIDNSDTASGQVTLIDSMMFARPTVATRSIGTEDYDNDGRTALLVPADDRQAMRDAIACLWDDPKRRAGIGAAARPFVAETRSDEATGIKLGSILDELADSHAK
jgi:glycosyltransferase involved in cell wall biosynthesis